MGFIVGAAVGVAVGFLYAPHSGVETREILKEKAQAAKEKAMEARMKAVEVAHKIQETAADVKKKAQSAAE
jgi:gas vesicle protein